MYKAQGYIYQEDCNWMPGFSEYHDASCSPHGIPMTCTHVLHKQSPLSTMCIQPFLAGLSFEWKPHKPPYRMAYAPAIPTSRNSCKSCQLVQPNKHHNPGTACGYWMRPCFRSDLGLAHSEHHASSSINAAVTVSGVMRRGGPNVMLMNLAMTSVQSAGNLY